MRRAFIADNSVALAVVVQVLIQADAAGVLFTANPMSGSRDELVINANWGLGEALVSGKVSPDTLVVKKKNGRVIKATVAVKSLMTETGAQGTHEVVVPEERRTERVLSNSEVRQLTSLARRIEGLYGSPQDVEWCRAEKKFYIVQSRPITRMPPEWSVPERNMFYGRSSLAEFLPGPVSPLFETFGLAAANDSSREIILRSTQVVWKYDLYTAMNGFMYVVGPTRPRDMLLYAIMTVRLMRYMRRSGVAHWHEARDVLRSAAAAWEERALAEMSPAELLAAARGLTKAATDYYGVVQSSAVPMSTMAKTSFTQLYNRLIRRKEDPDASVLLVGGETDALQAEKSIFELYGWVRERPRLAAWLGAAPAIDPNLRQRRQLENRANLRAEISRRLDPLRRKWFNRSLDQAVERGPVREDAIAAMGLTYPALRRIFSELSARLMRAGGSVTAPACVILGAEDFSRMRPGDVLVAVNTTPAWTPLFALASAVVTDIGGPLSHSSIVAREYGIPAVMATGVATRRIHNGQTVTVGGTSGTVTLA